MRSSAIHAAGGSFSFNGKTAYGPYVCTTLERLRFHLLRNVIPTVLIVVGASWVTLLLTRQIYEVKQSRREQSAVAARKMPQDVAINNEEAPRRESQALPEGASRVNSSPSNRACSSPTPIKSRDSISLG